MTETRYVIHTLFLLALPIGVAAFGLSPLAAVGLVLVALAWRWALALSEVLQSHKDPEPVLDTIPMSHFAEKVRWAMDRLDIRYTERPSAGVIGVLFTGRTVPRLRLRTGRARTSIGNSPEILRYLWGAHGAAAGAKAAFLEPTVTRLDYEKRIDRYGVYLQVWVFYHILSDRDLSLTVWGVNSAGVPPWQRQLLRICYPLLALFLRRAFAISDQQYARAVQQIEELLADVDTRLADGRRSILGEDEISFVDLAFAAMSGLWLQPEGYAAGKAESCRIARSRMPAAMQSDVERWIEDYPRATRFVEALYRDERLRNGTIDAGRTPSKVTQAEEGAET
jgi:glutathione S-transferase